jgi:hypothetical protein
LVRIGKPAVPEIINALSGRNAIPKIYLIFALEEIGTKEEIPEAVPALIGALKYATIGEYIERALLAIGMRAPETAIPIMLQNQNAARERRVVNEIIAKLGEPAIPYMLEEYIIAGTKHECDGFGRHIGYESGRHLASIDPIFSKIIFRYNVPTSGLEYGLRVGLEKVRKRAEQYLNLLRKHEPKKVTEFVAYMAVFYGEIGERTGQPAPEFMDALNTEGLRNMMISILLWLAKSDNKGLDGPNNILVLKKHEVKLAFIDALCSPEISLAHNAEEHVRKNYWENEERAIEIGLKKLGSEQREFLRMAKQILPANEYEKLQNKFAGFYIRVAERIRKERVDIQLVDCGLTRLAIERMEQRKNDNRPKMFRQVRRAVA